MTLLEQRPVPRGDEGLVLKTKRLILRAPRRKDARAIAALINDRRIADNTARIPYPYALRDAEEFIAQSGRGGTLSFTIRLADDTLIGGCGLLRSHEPAPELGYWIGVPYWGQGYASEAARAVIECAFRELGREALVAGARISNPASRRVLEKCDFQWTGVALQRVRALGTSVPCDRFQLRAIAWAVLTGLRRATAPAKH